MTGRGPRAAMPALRAARVSRSRLLAALLLVAAMLAAGLSGQMPGDATAAASSGLAADLRVGHTVEHITVPGSAEGESRNVQVHLWCPADQQDPSDRPKKTVYRSALYGRPLPEPWDPLSWTVE